MNFKFKSLKSDQFAYLYDSKAYNYKNNKGLHKDLFQFDTYGDGMTQHSECYPISLNNYVDCIYSLMSYLKDNINIVDDMFFSWRDISSDEINFFNELRYKEDKPYRYYNPTSLKVSGSESKRHDKRWFEIPSYCDGTVSNVRGLLCSVYLTQHGNYFNLSAFDYLAIMVQMEEHIKGFNWYGYELERNICIDGFNLEQMEDIYYAFKGFYNFIKGCKLIFNSNRYVDRYVNKKLES